MSLLAALPTPPDSPLSRRDPRWRLATLTLSMFAVAFLRGTLPSLAALILALLIVLVGRVPFGWFRDRIATLLIALIPFLIVVPFTVTRGEELWQWRVLRVTDEGVWVAIALAMKTAALISLGLTLIAMAPLHVTLAAAGKLGVPRLLIQIADLAVRYTHLLLDELQRIRIALRLRGFRNAMSGHAFRTIGHVTGTLVVHGSDRADRVAQAMRCRGFNGRFCSTRRFHSTFADIAMFVVIVGPFIGIAVWDLVQ